MRSFLVLIVSLFISLFSYSQSVDTVIRNTWYTSYYNYSLKVPVFVTYTLYKGGKSQDTSKIECDRSSYKFRSGGVLISAKSKDYSKTGYDQGHLVPYEDFSFDCKAAESTFRFYNVVPQTPNLNRGEWKKWELIIRRISKHDSLLVIAGGAQYKKTIGNKVGVPDICWKVVWSKSKKAVIYALIFKNSEDTGLASQETITNLEKKIGFEIRRFLK